MKSIIKIFISFLLLVLFQCGSKNTIDREIILSETLHTRSYNNKCALFVSRNFEISLQEVKEEFLAEFLNNNIFTNSSTEYHRGRQQNIFFIIIISNTGDYPVEVVKIELKYGNGIFKNLTPQDLKTKNQLFHDSMFDFFEITSEDLCLKDTEFLKNIKKYEKSSIEPGDKVIRLLAFNRVPAQYRKFKISLIVKSDIIQKIVDFKLIRFEYRHSGNHFAKPEKNDD